MSMKAFLSDTKILQSQYHHIAHSCNPLKPILHHPRHPVSTLPAPNASPLSLSIGMMKNEHNGQHLSTRISTHLCKKNHITIFRRGYATWRELPDKGGEKRRFLPGRADLKIPQIDQNRIVRIIIFVVTSAVVFAISRKFYSTRTKRAVFHFIMEEVKNSPQVEKYIGTPIDAQGPMWNSEYSHEEYGGKTRPKKYKVSFPIDGSEEKGKVHAEVLRINGEYQFQYLYLRTESKSTHKQKHLTLIDHREKKNNKKHKKEGQRDQRNKQDPRQSHPHRPREKEYGEKKEDGGDFEKDTYSKNKH